MRLPDEIALQIPLSWKDVLWGYEHGLIGWRAPVRLAKAKQELDHYAEFELSTVSKDDDWKVGDLLRELAALEAADGTGSARKWLYLSVRWIFETRNSEEDEPLGRLAEMSADFNFPDEIAHFAHWLPRLPEYDPRAHTPSENYEKVVDLWSEYLIRTGEEFAAGSTC